MNNARNEYIKRLHEVELYFNTLQLLDKGACSIKCVDILGNEETQEVDAELSKILKANGFLLLYNLIEATVRNSIDAILNSIHASTVTFRDLSDNLKKIWIKQEAKGINSEKSHEKVMLIAKAILDNEILSFEKDCINISGNIDAQKIREILKQFGGNTISNGRDLKTIKDKRNNLAHGEFTFSEIGKDYTVRDLIDYKDETRDYLSNVLDEIQDFIGNQKFLMH
jgi:hypothetical protein